MFVYWFSLSNQSVIRFISCLVMNKPNQTPSKVAVGTLHKPLFLFSEREHLLTPQKLKRIRAQEAFKKAHVARYNLLTKREIEIIKLLVRGFNNPKIAEQLFISRNTVQQHRKNINRKLKVKSFSELFQYALAFDLI